MLTSEKQNLVLQYISFSEKLAKSQFRKTPPQVQLDELISAAYMGLVDAAKKYDGKSDFKTYASWRINGEIKDYLRGLQWDRHNVKVSAIPESYDIPCEKEADNFDDVLDDVAKNHISFLAKNILRMYYGERLTITKIAEKVNLSSARISQLIKENVETLQKCA